MIRQLAHLNFVTNDLNKIADFYVKKLGLKEKFHLFNKDGIKFGVYFSCGNNTFLEFFDQSLAVKEWGGSITRLDVGTQYKHFCLEVVDLEEYCEVLKQKGVQVTGISTGMDHSRQAWIMDPDGNSIELMEYSLRSLQLIGNIE